MDRKNTSNKINEALDEAIFCCAINGERVHNGLCAQR